MKVGDLYLHFCYECGHPWANETKFSQTPTTHCPKCGHQQQLVNFGSIGEAAARHLQLCPHETDEALAQVVVTGRMDSLLKIRRIISKKL